MYLDVVVQLGDQWKVLIQINGVIFNFNTIGLHVTVTIFSMDL